MLSRSLVTRSVVPGTFHTLHGSTSKCATSLSKETNPATGAMRVQQQTARATAVAGTTAGRKRKAVASELNGSPVDILTTPSPPASPRGTNDEWYEVYNELHAVYNDLYALTQKGTKKFDPPAILVMGHQTDGKSALVEALMGFQFNAVGGGTKTRCPVTLHMKYDAAATQPICHLLKDDYTEQKMALKELQDHIDQENERLKADDTFSSKEIVVKVQYRACPNLTIIDLPGLIQPAPGDAVLEARSKQVEAIVRAKMVHPEYILLCLESNDDWSHATTRRLVMQVDPTLSRSVLVSTKFDTRLPQFAVAEDFEAFLNPDIVANMLGKRPFFTSVPAGRVGSDKDSQFSTNERFRETVAAREQMDINIVQGKMKRELSEAELSRVGVSKLRNYLEELLRDRYREAMPTIMAMLNVEARRVAARIQDINKQLAVLSKQSLKTDAREFVESFVTKLPDILSGKIAVPADKFGETLAEEHNSGGAFVDSSNSPLTPPDGLQNWSLRLFGGAQYHRAVTEFCLVGGSLSCPSITQDEIANACGVEDVHDGVNYMRAACLIGMAKGREVFAPFVPQLGSRLSYITRRLMDPALYLLEREGRSPAEHEALVKLITNEFYAFISDIQESCSAQCLKELEGTTRYMTWSLHTNSHNNSTAMIPSQVGLGGRTSGDDARGQEPSSSASTSAASTFDSRHSAWGQAAIMGDWAVSAFSGGMSPTTVAPLVKSLYELSRSVKVQKRLVPHTHAIDTAVDLSTRDLTFTSADIVAQLSRQVFEDIRDNIVQQAKVKFNCFFLMELIDRFPMHLRNKLETAFEEDVDTLFDVASIRGGLEADARNLNIEKQTMDKLQRKFADIKKRLDRQPASTAEAAREGSLN